MKAIITDEPGGADKLRLTETETPAPSAREVLVRVHYTALNRADIVQREGNYPPPPGASEILGLEIAGEVVETGSEVSRFQKGDKVFGLVPGGGYAEFATIHEEMAIPLPDFIRMEDAAAIPEVFLTAYQALFWIGRAVEGETLLVHAGASGVGSAAIQLAVSAGLNVLVTASESKHGLCHRLGADACFDYHRGSFTEFVKEETEGEGASVIIDFIGAPYFTDNLKSLRRDGRLVMLAFLGGPKLSQVNLRRILTHRLTISGSTLRSRPLSYQVALTRDMTDYVLPRMKTGGLRPVIDTTFDWQDVQEAHRYMEANKNQGKILLKVS